MTARSPACLVFLVGALVATAAQATCEDGVRIFPTPGTVLPTNAHLVLEGLSGEQQRVAALIGSSELVLFGEKETVPVIVERGWTSAMNRVAVRLKPKRALSPNTQYSLGLGRALPRAKLLNDPFGDNTPRWRTAAVPDTAPPRFTARTVLSDALTERPGGHAVTLKTQVGDAGAVYLLVSAVRGGRAVPPRPQAQTYLVPLEGDTATLGHDACSGSFSFEQGVPYKLSVELVDVAGNRAAGAVSLDLPARGTPEPEPRKVEPKKPDLRKKVTAKGK